MVCGPQPIRYHVRQALQRVTVSETRMGQPRYTKFMTLPIIRLVEGSHLPTRRTLDKLGIPRTTFYRWYDRYLAEGPEALEDRSPRPSRVWNRIPEPVRGKIKELALQESELSPRELAVQFTDTEKYFVSEASVYRIRECHELCVSGLAHAGFRYGHALKRLSNMIANWLRAANHSRTFLPPFSKLRIAR